MGVFDEEIDTAAELISENGREVSLFYYAGGTLPDATKPWRPSAGTPTQNDVDAVLIPDNPAEGPLTWTAYIAGKNFTVEIDERYTLHDGDDKYVILAAQKLGPSGDTILWTLRLKQWPQHFPQP